MRSIYSKSNLFLFSIFLLLISCQSTEEQPQQTGGTMEAEAIIVMHQELENLIQTTGSLMPNEEVQLKAEISGRVEKLNFEEGERIKKGQLLVQIDDAQYRAQLQRAKVQLEQASKNEQRQAQLLEVEGISQEAYEQAQLRVAELRAQQTELQATLDKSTIRAPFDGRIGLRMISPGGFVNPGDNIALLVQDNPLKVDFSIPEVYAHQIKTGDVIDFVVAGNKDTMQAEVYAIEPRISPNSRSLPVRAKATNQKGQLIPGAFAEIQVNLASFPNAILIPTSAVNTEITGKSVFIKKNGKVEKREITTGIRTAQSLQVLSGLNPGDTVLTTGLLGMKEGIPVRISHLNSNPENDGQ